MKEEQFSAYEIIRDACQRSNGLDPAINILLNWLDANKEDREKAILSATGHAWFGHCANCRAVVLRQRVPRTTVVYCNSKRCRKAASLGHEKPVSLSTIPTCDPSLYREIRQYHGGYSE